MVKSVVNEEFAKITAQHYAKAGFVRRRKGQRYPQPLPPFYLCDLPKENIELLGTGPGYDQHGGKSSTITW